jgi:hypothetical protein
VVREVAHVNRLAGDHASTSRASARCPARAAEREPSEDHDQRQEEQCEGSREVLHGVIVA